jgi:hypothetical protein
MGRLLQAKCRTLIWSSCSFVDRDRYAGGGVGHRDTREATERAARAGYPQNTAETEEWDVDEEDEDEEHPTVPLPGNDDAADDEDAYDSDENAEENAEEQVDEDDEDEDNDIDIIDEGGYTLLWCDGLNVAVLTCNRYIQRVSTSRMSVWISHALRAQVVPRPIRHR